MQVLCFLVHLYFFELASNNVIQYMYIYVYCLFIIFIVLTLMFNNFILILLHIYVFTDTCIYISICYFRNVLVSVWWDKRTDIGMAFYNAWTNILNFAIRYINKSIKPAMIVWRKIL